MITRAMFCIVCVLSVFIMCDDDEDDEHHPDPNWAYSSLWRQERDKEYEVRLSSEISPLFHDAFLRNPASDETEPNDFVAGMW
ncbi:MAG TPA: hypothetical protein VMX13_13755 [Sedimentisphaerales bacterium]|nr:hypothetical protein [Sedimentisphaerales bacterium]